MGGPAGIVDVVEAVSEAYGDWAKDKEEKERIAEFQRSLWSATLDDLRREVVASLDEVRRVLSNRRMSVDSTKSEVI